MADVPTLDLANASRADDEAMDLLIEWAQLIAPEDLLAGASMAWRFKRALACAIAKTETYPKRACMTEKIDLLKEAVTTIVNCIEDDRLAPVLLSGDAFFPHQREMIIGLEDLRARADGIEIRGGKGRDKHYARTDALTEQVTCALMIATAWNLFRGHQTPHNNSDAQKACALLWSAAGGRVGWSDTEKPSTSIWRNYLRAAKDAWSSREASHIRALASASGNN